MMMNYQQAWTFLDNLQFFKIKLGLDSMTGFLDSVNIGLPSFIGLKNHPFYIFTIFCFPACSPCAGRIQRKGKSGT